MFDFFLGSYLFYPIYYYYIAFQMFQNLYLRDQFLKIAFFLNSKFFLYNIIYCQASTYHSSFITILEFIIFRGIFKVKFSDYIIILITKIIIFTYNFFPIIFCFNYFYSISFPFILIDVSNLIFYSFY